MPFAPHEIEQKRFVTTLRGYHPEEVDSFLRAVAADYRAVLEEAEAARETAHIRDAAALIRAAETEAEAIRERARREGADIVELAKLEAEMALQEIDRLAQRLGEFERTRLYGGEPASVAVPTKSGDATAVR
jgi:DivIVA domain-containing protein